MYIAELNCSPFRPFKAEVTPVEATEDFPATRNPGFLIVSVPVVLRVCLLTAVCGAIRSFLDFVITSLPAAVAEASAYLPTLAAAVVYHYVIGAVSLARVQCHPLKGQR